MDSSLRTWRRICINVIRTGVLLLAILITLGVWFGSPVYFGIKILIWTESLLFAAVGAFFVLWGATYLGKAVLECSDRINNALKKFLV